jgi:hypothetical protein
MLDVQTKVAVTAAMASIVNAIGEAAGWVTDNTAAMAGIGGLIVLALTMRNTILQGRIARLTIEKMEHEARKAELKEKTIQAIEENTSP